MLAKRGLQSLLSGQHLSYSWSQVHIGHALKGWCCAAVTNTCRDEITRPLAARIDSHYGASFDIAGLGGVLTCGVTGLKAGLSHCPVDVRIPSGLKPLLLCAQQAADVFAPEIPGVSVTHRC